MTKMLSVLLFVGFTSPAWAQQHITVGPNVQVSKVNGNREHNEVILAADPRDPKHLLAGSMVYNPKKSDYNVVTYASFDGGSSWQGTLEVNHDPGLDGDPSTAIGCDGTGYSADLSVIGRRYQNQTLIYRSQDGGKTWLPDPVALPFSDREYLTVDCVSKKFHGRVYIHGNVVMKAADGARIAGTRIWVSDNGGQSFVEKNFPPASGRFSTYQGIGTVLTDGTFLAPFTDITEDFSDPDGPEGVIRVFRSTDGGNTFSNATMVSKTRAGGAGADVGLPNLAADVSDGSFRDRVYAVWADKKKDERNQIRFSYSTDKGSTWSSPITVNDDEAFTDGQHGPDDFMPEIAVNKNGVIGVSWYDRRDSTNDYDWTVRFTASLDGGKTFRPSVKVSEAQFTHNWAKSLPVSLISFGGGNFHEELRNGTLQLAVLPDRAFLSGGDTAGLVADADGAFHALWIDNRTGTAQVWTAPIQVDGIALRNGARELEKLDDITSKVMLRFGDIRYDVATHSVSAAAYLVNTSDETICPPVFLRVLGFEGGKAEILGSDNDQKGVGAVWDFSKLLQGQELRPGKTTEGKPIQFRVSDINIPQRKDKQRRAMFPVINAEVLGKAPNK